MNINLILYISVSNNIIIYDCLRAHGELSEWLKEHAWKACIRVTVSRVQIPHSPPLFCKLRQDFAKAESCFLHMKIKDLRRFAMQLRKIGRIGKICAVLGIAALLMAFNLTAQAKAAASQAYMQYMSAWASMASYSDKSGLLARQMLNEYGWHSDFQARRTNDSEAKFLLAQKQIDGKNIYLLAVTGTSSRQDIKTDLKTDSMVFGGTSPQQFIQVGRENIDENKPLVHQGFCQYVQDGFFTNEYDGSDRTLGEFLAAELSSDKNNQLYITGHSLGGAAAELLAARLSDMGADKTQLHVITFGAPAVGNQTFVDMYGPKLDLTRITMHGDPVKNLTQIANGKFVQFSADTKWSLPYSEADKFAHGMLLYFDRAICQYYDQQPQANIISNVEISFDFPPELADTQKYIEAALRENQQMLHDDNALKTHIIYKFKAQMLKRDTSNRRYYINAAKYVYDSKNRLISGGSASADTKEMTVVQASLYAAYQSGK